MLRLALALTYAPLARWQRRFLGRLSEWFIGPRAVFNRGLTRLFTEECDHLIRREHLSALNGDGRPFLEMLSTSLSNGLTCIFSHRGVMVDQGAGRPAITVDADTIPISLAVAASAAFPPLFPAVELSYQTLGVSEAELPSPHYVTDGGVYDNLGIQMLRWSDHPNSENLRLDIVVLSDAGAPFDITHQTPFRDPFSRNLRATEVMMYRNSVLTREALHHDGYAAKVVECRIGRFQDLDFGTTKEGTWHRTLRRAVAQIRTDFDRFTPSEVNLLVRHGYVVARDAFRSRPTPHIVPETPWLPLPDAELCPLEEVGTSVVLWRMPLNDGATWGILAVLLMLVAIISWAIFGAIHSAH